MRRQLLKLLKRQHLRQNIYQEFNQDYTEKSFSIEDILIMNEEIESEKKVLQQALDKIPTRMREALYLKNYHGLSYKKIALIMEINSQFAGNYVSEAFRRLRKIFCELTTY